MIKFKDLSGDLKTLVILGWAFVVINILAFLVGFIAGLLGV